MSDLVSTFLGFKCDREASALVLGKNLEIIIIRTEEAHESLVQDEDTEWKHGTVCGATWNAVELAHKRAGEATVTTLKFRSRR